jgi:hypothetical protein
VIDIRELLRETTADLEVDAVGAVGRVQRAVSRRRRFQVTTLGVVAAVALAIVIPVAAAQHNGGGHVRAGRTPGPSPSAGTAHRQLVQHWAPDDGGVTSGFGAVWAIQCCGGSTAPSWVDKLDSRDGSQVAHISVPGPTTSIAAGAGRIWTIGATDGGRSAISVINPFSRKATTLRLSDPRAEPDHIAFAQGSAWVTFNSLNQVWRLTPTASGIARSVLDVSGTPDSIATTGHGQLWVARLAGKQRLTRIAITGASAHLGETVRWNGFLYSPAEGALLASSGEHTILFLSPQDLSGCLACAQSSNIVVPGSEIYGAIWTVRGLFVSTFGNPVSGSLGRTYFWSRHAIRDTEEMPTAQVRGGGSLAPDGDGVVIGTGEGGITHWVPAG